MRRARVRGTVVAFGAMVMVVVLTPSDTRPIMTLAWRKENSSMTVCQDAPHLASWRIHIRGSAPGGFRDIYIYGWPRQCGAGAGSGECWLYRASSGIVCGKFQKMHCTMPPMIMTLITCRGLVD